MEEENSAAVPSLVGEVRGVQLFSDGSVVRTDKPSWPDIPVDSSFKDGVGSKDVVLDEQTGLWARIFLPQSAMKEPSGTTSSSPSSSPKKLPVLVYFHGGGFVAFNPSSSIFHNLCNNMCPKLGILVISVAYRLAPEHRLPVAFEDSFLALKWIQEQAKKHNTPVAAAAEDDAEPWMKHADVSNCFLMGSSAGGTIVHYMAVKANEYDFSPLKLKGLVPVVPFFGGEERSESEIRSLTRPDVLILKDTDTFWNMSLPEGADRDHPYSKCPTAEELVDVQMPPSLVVVGAKDVLHSRQVEYFEALKKAGKVAHLLEYKKHGHFLLFPEVEDDMHYSYNEMIDFMDRCMSQN